MGGRRETIVQIENQNIFVAMEDRLKLIEDMLSQNQNDPFLWYAAALEYKKNGSDDQAIHHLEQLIERAPDYLGSYYQLGKLYESKNEFEQAIEVYRKGKVVAKTASDQKTLGELTEALMILDADEEDF